MTMKPKKNTDLNYHVEICRDKIQWKSIEKETILKRHSLTKYIIVDSKFCRFLSKFHRSWVWQKNKLQVNLHMYELFSF